MQKAESKQSEGKQRKQAEPNKASKAKQNKRNKLSKQKRHVLLHTYRTGAEHVGYGPSSTAKHYEDKTV